MRRISLLFLVCGVVSACSGASNGVDTIRGSWRLTEGIVHGEVITMFSSHPITIAFEGDQVAGSGSCNSYGGSFERDGSSISFRDLAMTEMACVPAETMDAEQVYLRGLSHVAEVAVDGALRLSGPDVEMVFQRLEPN